MTEQVIDLVPFMVGAMEQVGVYSPQGSPGGFRNTGIEWRRKGGEVDGGYRLSCGITIESDLRDVPENELGVIGFNNTGTSFLVLGAELRQALSIRDLVKDLEPIRRVATEVCRNLMVTNLSSIDRLAFVRCPGMWVGTNLGGLSFFSCVSEVWYRETATDFGRMIKGSMHSRVVEEKGDVFDAALQAWINAAGNRCGAYSYECFTPLGAVKAGIPCMSVQSLQIPTTEGQALLPHVAPRFVGGGQEFCLGYIPHYYNWFQNTEYGESDVRVARFEWTHDEQFWNQPYWDATSGWASVDLAVAETEPPVAYGGINYAASWGTRMRNLTKQWHTREPKYLIRLAEIQAVLPFDMRYLLALANKTDEVTTTMSEVLERQKTAVEYARGEAPDFSGSDVKAVAARILRDLKSGKLPNFKYATSAGSHPCSPVALNYFVTEAMTNFASWTEYEQRLLCGSFAPGMRGGETFNVFIGLLKEYVSKHNPIWASAETDAIRKIKEELGILE